MLLFIMYCNKPAVVSILSSRALLHDCDVWLIVAHPEFSFLAGEGRREVTGQKKPSVRQVLWFSGSLVVITNTIDSVIDPREHRIVFGTQMRS